MTRDARPAGDVDRAICPVDPVSRPVTEEDAIAPRRFSGPCGRADTGIAFPASDAAPVETDLTSVPGIMPPPGLAPAIVRGSGVITPGTDGALFRLQPLHSCR